MRGGSQGGVANDSGAMSVAVTASLRMTLGNSPRKDFSSHTFR